MTSCKWMKEGGCVNTPVEVGREGDRLAVTIEGHFLAGVLFPRWFDREETKQASNS